MSWSLESQLEHSEALREEAHVMNFSLEESKSELASRLEVLESEKKQLEEKIVMLEAADAERMEQLKVATEGLTMCCADIEWVLTKSNFNAFILAATTLILFSTIKVFVPRKPPVDYQGAREAKPITEFALKQVKTLLKDKLSGKTTITESSVQKRKERYITEAYRDVHQKSVQAMKAQMGDLGQSLGMTQAFGRRRLHLWPTTPPPPVDDASTSGLQSTRLTKSPTPAYSRFCLLLSRCLQKDKRPLIEPLPISTQAAPILLLHDQEKEKENVNVEEAKEHKKKAKKKQEYEKNLPRKKRRKLEASKEMMGDEAENRVQKEKLYKTMQEPMMPKKLFKSHNILESFPIVSEPGIFNAVSVETVISSVAIMEILKKEQLDISCILWYQIMLHSLMLVSRMDNKCGFINPQCITSTRCEYDDRGETDHVINDLVDVMNFHEEKQFFLAPYWERRHWMLIVIYPHQYKSYILDSARGTKTLKDYTIVEHVNKAVTRFKKTKTNKSCLCPMTWIFPKCNQQLSDWECGYYVMNWMNEFVLFRQHGFPKNIWKDKKTFSSEELEERVKTWMRTFGDKVKPFCKAYNESTTKGKERLEVTKGKERWEIHSKSRSTSEAMEAKSIMGSGNVLGLTLDTRMLGNDKLRETFELKADASNKMDKMMLFIPEQSQKRKNLTGSCSKDKKLLGSLKILNLSFCYQLRSLVEFEELPALESLVDIFESIGQCVELVVIDLSYCNKLGKLPRTISALKKVTTLLLDGSNTVSPKLYKDKKNLISTKTSTSLESIWCDSEASSDWKLITLPSRVRLPLSKSKLSTESFPIDFSCLSMLRELCLYENPIVSLPNCMRSLPRRESLSIKNSEIKSKLLGTSSVKFEGLVEIQPMEGVEDKIFHSLGWTKLAFLKERHVETSFWVYKTRGI
ncbi:unnamed protein product [Lactuca saligna]|uniref:Ubiquitin-like protease family profile domain-containing protein n=1 Tax=Lactuca saligna TaxID=75948 RepID=A0AA35VMA0_LACSI|nr:unnamed protein product [Lactuca saligna]